jgi:hypothetical protein
MRISFTQIPLKLLLLICFLHILIFSAKAQKDVVKGRVINYFTNEPISFASVRWKVAGNGVVTDSVGFFKLPKKNNSTSDTIIVSYIGYEDVRHVFNIKRDTGEVTITLPELKVSHGVEVKSKFNKGLRWWKAVVAHKKENDPYQYNNYAYELYNKLELDINNIDRIKLENNKTLKPFAFVLKNIDSTTEAKPFLPIFLTESLSNYYYSNNSNKTKEVITATQTNGIKNETVTQFLGGVSGKVNVYENFITIFGKEFISPISSIGDKYYNYKGADTQTINQEKYYHLYFTPKQEGTNTFVGDCWIHSTTWAIQKVSMTVATTANINFVHRLVIIQEFTQQNKKWIFFKDKFIADLSPFKKEKLSFIGRKTATYKNIQINQPYIDELLGTNKQKNEVIIEDTATEARKNFWNNARHEPLSLNENKVYTMIDTLKQMPLFKTYSNRLLFLVDGRKKLGAVEIGPWYKWISGNQLERLRIRFDLGTTQQFSQHLRLYGYAAYGFKDGRWKGKLGFDYKINHHENWNIFSSYTDDLDNGRIKYNDDDDATVDNVFSQLIRRQNIRQKFLGVQDFKIGIGKKINSEWSTQFYFNNIKYSTYTPLPSTDNFIRDGQSGIINSEFGLKLRYAPGERQITTTRRTFRIKTNLPIIEIKYGLAISGLFKSGFNYDKISVYVSQQFRIPRWGQFSYMVYGGKYWGDSIPFMMLEVHPGNEIYYYNKNSFNLMNRFEYVSDHYFGLNIEHNFEKKLLNLIPFMRKSKMRQFWNVKTVWGDLNTANRAFNRLEFPNYRLRRLREEYYTEVGTGFDNIFKYFRIDLVWRFAPTLVLPPNSTLQNSSQTFGIFGSFRVQF